MSMHSLSEAKLLDLYKYINHDKKIHTLFSFRTFYISVITHAFLWGS